MSNTFCFYSISQEVADAVLAGITASKDSSIEGNIIKGKTPLGEVTLQYDYVPQSKVVTVSILSKPFIVSSGMIETQIRDALNTEAALIESKRKVESAVIPQEATPLIPSTGPGQIPAPKEVVQTVAAALGQESAETHLPI